MQPPAAFFVHDEMMLNYKRQHAQMLRLVCLTPRACMHWMRRLHRCLIGQAVRWKDLLLPKMRSPSSINTFAISECMLGQGQ